MKNRDAIQRRRPRQARARFTRDSIVEAAAELLRRSESLTTNSIAERAGVSIGTLYQYFPDKNAILVAVARREMADDLASPYRALLAALIASIESLLGRAAVRSAPRQRRAPSRGDLATKFSRFEELLQAWIAPPLPAWAPPTRR